MTTPITRREKKIIADCERVIASASQPRSGPADGVKFHTLGICALRLGRFPLALGWFRQAVNEMSHGAQPLWLRAHTLHEPIELALLSNRIDAIPRFVDVSEDEFAHRPIAIFTYSLALASLARGADPSCARYVDELRQARGAKVFSAQLEVLESIMSSDLPNLQHGMQSELKSHDNAATHGELRGSPQAYISTSALAFLVLAARRNLHIEIENPYAPAAYVQYVLGG